MGTATTRPRLSSIPKQLSCSPCQDACIWEEGRALEYIVPEITWHLPPLNKGDAGADSGFRCHLAWPGGCGPSAGGALSQGRKARGGPVEG